MKHKVVLEDSKQTYWQLGSILGTALGLPSMLIGGVLARRYGVATAFTAIVVGNLLLWMIGLGILGMTKGRNHAIENTKEYLGKVSGFFNSLVLMVAITFWFSLQLGGATEAIAGTLIKDKGMTLRLGVALGFVCALFGVGGVKLLKKICVIALPFILFYQIYALLYLKASLRELTFGKFSLSAIALVVIIWLAGIINLSTIFRHSRSKADSVLGLSLMTVLHIIFQSFSVILFINKPQQLLLLGKDFFYLFFSLCFVVISLVCVNFANTYYGSVTWEMIIPSRFRSLKLHAIIGMSGTLVYALFQQQEFLWTLERVFSNFIACLAIVLLISFLMRTLVQHRPRPKEKLVNSLAWYAGCVAVVWHEMHHKADPTAGFIVGISTSIVFFLCVLLVEETVWAVSKKMEKR